MKKNVARNYLEISVESATPLKLVVLLYDIVIDSLKAASRALAEGNVERRVAQVNRAMAALGELQSALDFETGGEVATQLARLYTVSRRKLFEANSQPSHEAFDSLTAELVSVREAWIQVERSVGLSENGKYTSRSAPATPHITDGLGGDWSA